MPLSIVQVYTGCRIVVIRCCFRFPALDSDFPRWFGWWPVLLDLHSCLLFFGYLRGWLCNFERLLVLELPLASRYKDTTLDLSFPAFIFINIIDPAVDGLKELEMCDLIAALSISLLFIEDCMACIYQINAYHTCSNKETSWCMHLSKKPNKKWWGRRQKSGPGWSGRTLRHLRCQNDSQRQPQQLLPLASFAEEHRNNHKTSKHSWIEQKVIEQSAFVLWVPVRCALSWSALALLVH